MEQCGELVPRFPGSRISIGDDEDGECLLKEGHEGWHLVKTSEEYHLWQPQEEYCRDSKDKICGCEYIECYVSQHITDAEAKKILAKDGAGTN